MAHIKIKKGHNIRIAGHPEQVVHNTIQLTRLTIIPLDYKGIKPKLLVKVGDEVKIGTPLFFDKLQPSVKFTSPGGGTVSDIKFGERRRIEEIVINLNKKESAESFKKYDESLITGLNSTEIKEQLLSSGLWTVIRQRPFSKIANPELTPKSIFVSTYATAPLAPNQEFLLSENSEGFQSGLNILSKLTSSVVNLVNDKKSDFDLFTKAKNVELHTITGPHPAGNVGIQIHHIDPIKQGDVVWTISPQDVKAIGELFLTGKYPTTKLVAIAGDGVEKQHYLKTRRGAVISDLLKDNPLNEDVRIITGDVLTGRKTTIDSAVGFYDNLVTIIPEGRKRLFMGWALPGLNRYSLSNSFLSKLLGKKEFSLDTNQNGGERAIVPFGSWESVLPMDILPTFLVKSILAQDIDEMEKLGIYECDEEDFALCAFSCPSKLEITEIIQQGLELVEKEG
ncbi:MAG: Na(+)-translocating NADH-quinone reductase subunit A [Candidatus Marinimicrobia bacterium]|nr:Na(+)-translocating NADH-quinone reductase subunit A [Candidatus Neomarinimicrobiota bacterium]MBL7022985.1 Na(+)-translocating NADH-quinone reductase subunit A [Candidatus Neomarinimicrobiota bacterium]